MKIKTQARKLWESRSPRDRLIILILAAVVGAMLYVSLVQSASRARAQLGSSVFALRAQAIRLDHDATEMAKVRAAPVPPVPQTDLRTQLQAQVTAAGLADSLLRIEVVDANQVRAVFGSISFADWLAWVASLQKQHIRLDTGRIEALSTPGLVGVTATFIRARPK